MVKILTDERINKSLEAARTKAALQAELETVRFEKSIEAARTKAILQASTVTRHGPQTQSTEDDLTETFEVSRTPPPLAAHAFDTVSRPCPDFHPVAFFFLATPFFMEPWLISTSDRASMHFLESRNHCGNYRTKHDLVSRYESSSRAFKLDGLVLVTSPSTTTTPTCVLSMSTRTRSSVSNAQSLTHYTSKLPTCAVVPRSILF